MLLIIRKSSLSCLLVSEVDIYLKYANKTLYAKTPFVRSEFSIKFQLDCHGFLHLFQGSLIDGTVFHSSFERGDPIEFEIYRGQVIKG